MMTPRRLSTIVLVSSLFAGCAKEPEEPTLEERAETAGITPAAVAPRFGGQPVIAGARVVEVLPHEGGEIEAEVRDAAGEPIANAKLEVSVRSEGGEAVAVPLKYRPRQKRYVGSAPSKMKIAPGPVEVHVASPGAEKTVGVAPMVAVAPEPAHGGQVVLLGPQAPEVRLGADGTVHAYVPTEDGELEDGELYAHVPVAEGEPLRVELEYDDDERAYVAELDSDVHVVPGPVELELEVDDVVHRGRIAEVTIAPRPTLGGEVVVAGDYGVEVAPVEGELRANLYDRRGRPVEDRPPVIVVRAEGHPRPVRLRWNASAGYYAAPIPANVTVSAAPVHVEVRHRGRRHHGRLHVHGAHRPVAHVDVVHPVAEVEVVAPAPHVDVKVRRPGVVLVHDHHHHGKHRKHRKVKHRKVKHQKVKHRGHKRHKKLRFR